MTTDLAPRPKLSLAMIVRDPESGPTLSRCLHSVIDRPGGALVDEIVIVYAGEPYEECAAVVDAIWRSVLKREDALERERPLFHTHVLPAEHPRNDKGGLTDFASARNYSFSLCKGEWILWLDGDDVVPGADAAEAQAKKHGRPVKGDEAFSIPRSLTLRDLVGLLPKDVNMLTVPYHYSIDDEGNVVNETVRERVVRWKDGFAWSNGGLGCHECVVPLPGTRVNAVPMKNWYIEHRPCQSAAVRQKRNDELVKRAEGAGIDNWRLRYFLARSAEQSFDFAKAEEEDKKAIGLARVDEERFTSLHCLSRVQLFQEKKEEALVNALVAWHVRPDRPEGVAGVVRVLVEAGDVARAITWYERLLKTTKRGGEVALEASAYEYALWPHVVIAPVFTLAGRHDEAVAAAERALAFASYDVGAQQALARAREARDLAKARDAAVLVAKFISTHADPNARVQVLSFLPDALAHDPRVRAAARAAERAAEEYERFDPEVLGLVLDIGEVKKSHPLGAAPHFLTTLDLARTYLALPGVRRLEGVADAHGKRTCEIELVNVPTPTREAWLSRPTVHFYCPAYIEAWGPWTPERTGIGGSEEIAICIPRLLAREGFRVTVFCPVEEACVRDGVLFRPLEDFDHEQPCDALVSHRTVHLLQQAKLGAKKHFVWLHDTMAPEHMHYISKWQDRVEKFLVVSEWHREHVHEQIGLAYDRMEIVRYCAEPEDEEAFDHEFDQIETAGKMFPGQPLELWKRNPHRAIYASAPYRGLAELLDLWPRVRELVPDAELHCCYGWKVHQALAARWAHLADMKRRIEANLGLPGVLWRDRLPTQALRDLYLSAGVFVYPSTFDECAGRAAIRAQVLGCVPVVTPRAALRETIVGGVKVEGDPADPAVQKVFAESVARCMLEGPSAEERRRISREARALHAPLATWKALLAPAAAAVGVEAEGRAT